ncbi:hypothetical protein [Streptomyces sp. NPDC054887]
MKRNDDTSPVEPVNNWHGHADRPEGPVDETPRMGRALKVLRLLLLVLAVLAAVLSFAAALANLARP